MANIYETLIGSGALFPIKLNTNEEGLVGWYPVNGDPDLINHNLTSLVNYTIGERFRQENFGTRLWECIEEPNTQAMSYMVNNFLKSAISTYEPRITLTSSTVTRKNSIIDIEFTYIINNTNSSITGNLTYDQTNNTLTI